MSIKFVIACKQSPEYSVDYIYHIAKNLKQKIHQNYELIVYTDIALKKIDHVEDYTIKPLEFSLRGWWSKLECFKETGPCIYIDLDTTILGDLDNLINKVLISNNTFFMLEVFNPLKRDEERTNRASGVMAWNGNFLFILDEAINEGKSTFEGASGGLKWDQLYTSAKVRAKGYDIPKIQDYCQVFSYKDDVIRQGKNPMNADIIAFHGQPRPIDVKGIYWYS